MYPQQMEKLTERGVRGLILNRLDSGSNSWIDEVAMRIQSDQATEDYAWLGATPAMRKQVGGMLTKQLRENSFSITNDDHEAVLAIKSKDVRRDKLGMIQTRINQLADRAMDYPASLLTTLIQSGESTVCYDGQFFFDTDHAEGDSGTQSNDIGASASTATAPTADEMAEAIMKAVQAIVGFKDDAGEPMNASASSFAVMVPTTFMASTLKAVTALLGTAGVSATIPALREYVSIQPIVNPRLTWTSKFAVLRTDEAAKPFILQEEYAPNPWVLGDGSEHEIKNKEWLCGVDWSGAVGYAYWQHAALVTLS